MRFADLLRTTVLLCMAGATSLGIACVAAASNEGEDGIVFQAAGWWFVAGVVGGFLGRRTTALPAIRDLLAAARPATMMPEHRPGSVVLNRLWPIVLLVVLAGGLAFVFPQVPGIAAGFFVIWALYWRHQNRAVEAVEERDGVTFYVERTSPVQAIRLLRAPGFRREVPTSVNGAG